MTLAAVAATDPSIGRGTIALLVLAALALYVLACVIWPFAPCRWCRGKGKHRSPTGRAFRDCWACAGTARRVRLGRKLYIALSGTYRNRNP